MLADAHLTGKAIRGFLPDKGEIPAMQTTTELTSPLDRCEQYPTDPAGLEFLEPMVAHTLRRALSSYRTPTAARARLLNYIGKATSEIEQALALAKTGTIGPMRRITGGTQ
jgi:hypothetical protein